LMPLFRVPVALHRDDPLSVPKKAEWEVARNSGKISPISLAL
jgi:hypothetical protein